jgi:hypothetical protein
MLRGALQMERDMQGGEVFLWLQRNRVNRQLPTSVAFSTAGIAPSMRRGEPQPSGGRGAAVGQNNVALHIATPERSTMDRSPSHLLRVANLPASRALPNIPLQSPCHSGNDNHVITLVSDKSLVSASQGGGSWSGMQQ